MNHSTGKPTKTEAARMDAIKDGDCLACILRFGAEYARGHVPEVHHLLSGNKRRGHLYTVALCGWHHRGDSWGCHKRGIRQIYGPSLAEGSKPFHAAFGTDDDLLKMQNELIGVTA